MGAACENAQLGKLLATQMWQTEFNPHKPFNLRRIVLTTQMAKSNVQLHMHS